MNEAFLHEAAVAAHRSANAAPRASAFDPAAFPGTVSGVTSMHAHTTMLPILRRTSLSLWAIASLLLAAPLAAEPGVKGNKPERIAQGQRVDIEDYVVEGKTTIIDFTSDYCPPCRRVSPLLDALHAKRDDVAVVKVDINRPEVRGIDWRSPVAQQYRLQSVPHFKVYGPDKKLVAEGDEAAEMVFRMIEQNS